MTNKTQAVQEETRTDHRGANWPISLIKPIDLARDALVMEIVKNASAKAAEIAALKVSVFNDINAFVSLSAEQYGVKLGGEKGNVTLLSFDGRYKVLRSIQEKMVFDERLLAAKALIDACLQRWSQGAQPELKALVNDAFQVDKAGNINTGRVLGLRRLEINDPEWIQAMKAVGEALQVAGSKAYVRIYERVGTSDEYRQIPLDMAGA